MEKMVTIDELARYLTVSKSTIRGWIRRHLLPPECYVKIGNTYRFSIPKIVDTFKPEADHTIRRWADFPFSHDETPPPYSEDMAIDAVPAAEDIVDPLAEMFDAVPELRAPPRLSPADVFGDDDDEPN